MKSKKENMLPKLKNHWEMGLPEIINGLTKFMRSSPLVFLLLDLKMRSKLCILMEEIRKKNKKLQRCTIRLMVTLPQENRGIGSITGQWRSNSIGLGMGNRSY